MIKVLIADDQELIRQSLQIVLGTEKDIEVLDAVENGVEVVRSVRREKPDVILNLVDASNIERNLYLTTQLTEVGIPVVVALNMIDVVKRNGDTIDTAKLSKMLGCPVIETAAVKGQGTMEAAERAVKLAQEKGKATFQHSFDDRVEQALSAIGDVIQGRFDDTYLSWYEVKLFFTSRFFCKS